MSSYSDKLKDPRWQKKRLEIMQRDNWTCQLCFDTEETLQVHHKKYIYNKSPWEYDNKHLITVCETCHRAIEAMKKINGFKMELLRVCCVSTEGDALSIYRYESRQPVIIIKRGTLITPSKIEATKIIEILKHNG